MSASEAIWVDIFGFWIAASEHDEGRFKRFLSSIGVREHRWWRRLTPFKTERIRAWLADNGY